MLPQILLMLVLMAGMQPLHSFSYNVSNVTVECGEIGATLSEICVWFKPYLDSHSQHDHRGKRSVSTDVNTDPSRRQEATTQRYHHPRATQMFLTDAANTSDSVVWEKESMLTMREVASNLVNSKIASKLVKHEVASSLVKSRFRRGTNVQDECCSYVEPRQCVYEELHEYCEPMPTSQP